MFGRRAVAGGPLCGGAQLIEGNNMVSEGPKVAAAIVPYPAGARSYAVTCARGSTVAISSTNPRPPASTSPSIGKLTACTEIPPTSA